MDKKFSFKDFLNNFEVYIGTCCFFFLLILLTIQVISRYLFGHAFTWAEELATMVFVWTTYFGIAAAVTHRKHLRIDALLASLPFKWKRALLILSNIIFIFFNTYLIFPYINIIRNLGTSSSSILKIPKAVAYVIIPIMMTVSSVRLIQDSIRLSHENMKTLGASKPLIDLEALEKEWEEKKKCQQL